jgi:hypothetical protein
MTRLQRGYLAIAIVGFIVSLANAWREREYTLCGLRDPSLAQRIDCRESPVLDTTEFATDFAFAMGWVGALILVIWLILWVLRGK